MRKRLFIGICFVGALALGCGSSERETPDEGGDSGADVRSDGASGGTAGAGGEATGGGGTAGDAGAGGEATGGAAGMAGGAGTGGSAPGFTPECMQDKDCTLYDDCCQCVALAPGENPANCTAVDCGNNTACRLRGLDAKPGKNQDRAMCISGKCRAGFVCDASLVAAISVTSCPNDTETHPVLRTPTPAKYSKECVPKSECRDVGGESDCGVCATNANAYVCGVFFTPGSPPTPQRAHCVDLVDACAKDQTCKCLTPSVCGDSGTCQDIKPGTVKCTK